MVAFDVFMLKLMNYLHYMVMFMLLNKFCAAYQVSECEMCGN